MPKTRTTKHVFSWGHTLLIAACIVLAIQMHKLIEGVRKINVNQHTLQELIQGSQEQTADE